jgi:hypothetical protein
MKCRNCGKPIRITWHGTVRHANRGEWIHCDTQTPPVPLSTVAEVEGGAVCIWQEEECDRRARLLFMAIDSLTNSRSRLP